MINRSVVIPTASTVINLLFAVRAATISGIQMLNAPAAAIGSNVVPATTTNIGKFVGRRRIVVMCFVVQGPASGAGTHSC